MQESRGEKRRGAQNVNSRAHSYNRMSAGARASGSLKAKLSVILFRKIIRMIISAIWYTTIVDIWQKSLVKQAKWN